MRVCDEEGNYYECEYDAENLLTRMVHANSGGRVATNYRYDKDGRETKTIIGQWERTTSYDALGRVVSQNWNIPEDAETGAVANTMAYGYPEANGNREGSLPSYVENNAGRYEYFYNVNGNITKIIVRSTESGIADKIERYQYDGLNQLVREDSGIRNKSILYTYDAGGNLTSIREYEFLPNQSLDEVDPLRTYTGVYAGSTEAAEAATGNNEVWKDQLLSWEVEDSENGTPVVTSMTYDAIGNMLTKGSRSFSWRQGRKLVGVTDGDLSVSYEYDHTGNRVKKSVVTAPGATPVVTTYCMAGDLLLSEQRGNDTIWYQYDSNANVVAMRLNGKRYFYVRNLQNDIIALTDRNGNVVVRYQYDAWGNEVSRTGTLANTVGVKNPFRYRGYYYDAETGMYYLKSRFYDPEILRFVNADGYVSTGQGVLGTNMFAYCGNNPVNRVDYTGQFWSGIWEFTKTAVAQVGKAMGLMSPAYAGCGGAAAVDGPLPFGDVVAVAGAALLTVGAIGYGIYQAAQSPAISIPKTEEKPEAIVITKKPDSPVIFPVDPNIFNPVGLVKVPRAGTKNGAFISWMDPFTNTEVFRWDENPNYSNGSHYHIHGAGHYYPGTIVPEPYATIYFPFR